MENFNTATEAQDERVVGALQLGAEDAGDDDGADPIRSLPRPSKPVPPGSQTRSDSTDGTDVDGDRSLRPIRPSQARSDGTDVDGDRSLRTTRPSAKVPPSDVGPSNSRLPS